MLIRSLKIVSGTFLVIGGIIVTPMPIPLGILMIVVGLSLLASSSRRVREWIKSQRRRYQELSAKLNAVKHRVPPFARRLIEETDPGH